MAKIDKVSTIKVYQADDYGWAGGDEVTAHGSADIFGYLDTWPLVRRKLGEPDVLSFTVQGGSDWAVDKTLKARQRLRVDYSDGSFDLWRIREVSIRGEGGPCLVTALPLWTDLGDRIFRWVLAPTEAVRYWVPMTNITVSDALARVFDEDYGINETQFTLGTVDATIGATVINLNPNGVSHLEVIRQIINEAQIETDGSVELEITHSSDAVVFNVYEEAGWTAAERTAGSADATLRPIEAPNGGTATSEGNRRSMRITDAQDDYYSRIVPFGLDEEEQVGIDGTIWDVDAVSAVFGGGDYTCTLTLEGSPIWEDDCLNGYFLKVVRADGGITRETITDCIAPNQVVIVDTRDLSTGNDLATTAEFMDAQGAPVTTEGFGTSLSFLPDQTAEADRGRVEKVIEYPDHPPFENLFDEHGGDADFSGTYNTISASKSLPAGMESYPSSGENATNTYGSDSDAEFVHYGSKSFKVYAVDGEGAQTEEITLPVDPDKPYISIWAALRVRGAENTAVRMEVIEIDDDTGDESTVWPTGTLKAESSDTNMRALKIEGIQPTNEKIRVRFTTHNADLPGTYASVLARTFYLDALVITNSATAYEYQPNMGKKGLWERASAELLRSGGVRDDEYDSDLFDVGVYASSGSNAPITLGSHVTIKDLYDSAAATWRVEFTGRVVELLEDWNPLDGTIWKTVKVAKIRPTLEDRFLRTPRKHKLPEVPLQPKTQTTEDSGSGTDPDEIVDDAVSGLSQIVRECGWISIPAASTASSKVTLSNSLPIVKGHLRVTRVSEEESGTAVSWGANSYYIRHNVFDVRLGAADTKPNVFWWSWDYPCPLPVPDCWWDDLITANVILHIEFDEGAGQTAHDLSTGGYNAVVGSTTAVEASLDAEWVTEGVYVDGSDEVLFVDESTDKDGNAASDPLGTANFTVVIVAQAYDPADANKHYLICRGAPSTFGVNYGIYFKDDGGSPFVYGMFGDGVANYELKGPAVTDDTWYMFTLRYDGANLKIATNRLSSETSEARTETPVTNEEHIYIGHNADGTSGEEYEGKIAYLRIFDTALTDAQVRAEYDTLQCILSSRGTILDEIADLKDAPEIAWVASDIGNAETALAVGNPPRIVWEASEIATESDGDPWIYYKRANTGDAEEHKIYRRQPSDTAGTGIEQVFNNDPEVPAGSGYLGLWLPNEIAAYVVSAGSGEGVREYDLSDGTTATDIEDPETWGASVAPEPWTQGGRWLWNSDDDFYFGDFGGGNVLSIGSVGGTGGPNRMLPDPLMGTLFVMKGHPSGGKWIKAFKMFSRAGSTDVIPSSSSWRPAQGCIDIDAQLIFFSDIDQQKIFKVDYSDPTAWPVTPTEIVDLSSFGGSTTIVCECDPVNQKLYYRHDDGDLYECNYDGTSNTSLWTIDYIQWRFARDGQTFGTSSLTLPMITWDDYMYQMELDGTGRTMGVGRGSYNTISTEMADMAYDNENKRAILVSQGNNSSLVQIIDYNESRPRTWLSNYPQIVGSKDFRGVGWDDSKYYFLNDTDNRIESITRSSDWANVREETPATEVNITAQSYKGFSAVPAAQAYNSELFFYSYGSKVYSNNLTWTSERTIGDTQSGGTSSHYCIDSSPGNEISFTTANGNTVGVLVWTVGGTTSGDTGKVGLATFSSSINPADTNTTYTITSTANEQIAHVCIDATNSKLYVTIFNTSTNDIRIESYDFTTVSSTDEVTLSGKTTHQTLTYSGAGEEYFERFVIAEANA